MKARSLLPRTFWRDMALLAAILGLMLAAATIQEDAPPAHQVESGQ